MNLRTTLLLVALAAGGGALWYFHDTLARRLGYARPKPGDAERPTAVALEKALRPELVSRIELHVAGAPVVLERKGKAWSLPGGWPARGPEVAQVVDAICGMSSRFDAIKLPAENPDLAAFGLAVDQKPLKVDVTVEQPKSKDHYVHHLTIGEARTGSNPFTRPTYLRLNQEPEVVRLPPGLLAVLGRPLATYRKRQLFPEVERVKFPDARPSFEADAPLTATALVDASALKVSSPAGTLALKRVVSRDAMEPKKPGGIELSADALARRWELTAPFQDHVDPEKLKGLLAAVPDLWAETFVDKPDPAKTGLDKPERTLTVEFDDRAPVTLQIGNVSREVRRKGAEPPPPSPFGAPPPPPQETVETYRYAKVPNNPQVFEVRADKLDAVFVAPAAARDAKPFRFRANDAKRVEVVRETGKIVLAKEKDASAGGVERWKLVEPAKADADTGKVLELIDKIADLNVPAADILDKYDAKALRLDPDVKGARVQLDIVEEAKGDKPAKSRTLTLRLGKHDAPKSKVYVQAVGNARVNVVGDDILKLVDRPALAYRGKRVIDVASNKVASVAVTHGGESFKLTQADGKWSLAEPAKGEVDAAKAAQLAGDVSRLEAVEFVTDAAKPDELARFGLDKPTVTAALTFADNLPAKTLQVGKAREGKPEWYAKLADSPAVFVVRTALHDALDQPAVAYRPLSLWSVDAAKIDAVEITRGGEPYALAHKDGAWKLSGPFDANAVAAAVQPIVNALAAPKAERYEAATAADAAKYGLDKPALTFTVVAGKDEKKPKHTLLVGKPSAEGATSRFAKRADDPAVFVVPAALLSAIDHAPLQLVDRKLLAIGPADVASVKGTGPGGSWELTNVGGEWLVASLSPAAPADRPAVDSLLNVFAGLEASRLAGYGPKADLVGSGLSQPETRVTVVKKDGKAHTIAVGKATDGGDRYVRVDDGPAVAVLPNAYAKQLTREPLEFVNRTLLTANPADVMALKREGDGGELEFTRSAEGWAAVKPETLKPDQPTLDEVADNLAHLRAVRIAGVNAKDLKPFGLDKPAAVVTLGLKAGNKVIKVGGPADGEERYATVDGTNVVAVLPAALSKKLVAEPLKYRDRAITRFNDADKAVVERAGRKVTFAKVDGTWKMTEPAAADADSAELDELMNLLGKLRADELVVEKPDNLRRYGLDPPEAHWVVTAGEREVLDVMVGSADADGRHFAKRGNGVGIFLLDKGLSTKMLTEYRHKALWADVDAAAVETLVYNVGERTLVLQKVGNNWQISGRPEQAVNAPMIADMLAALATLKVERYVVDKGAEFKLYGLQPPVRTIVVKPRSGPAQTLYLGTFEDASKRVYARLQDKERSDVFVLSEADSAKLVKELRDFTK